MESSNVKQGCCAMIQNYADQVLQVTLIFYPGLSDINIIPSEKMRSSDLNTSQVIQMTLTLINLKLEHYIMGTFTCAF
jgi:hypothetical protein